MKNFFLFLYGWFCYVIFCIENRYKFFYWKSIDFYQHHFSIENQLIFTSIIFLLKINTNFSIENQLILIAILYWKSMKNFLLKKNNWFVSFKNFRITLYFLYRDFQRHFSIDFAILLKLPFYIKNQYTFFYWKSIGFCQHHFSTENQYKIFYWITCTFSTCDFVLKTNQKLQDYPLFFI